LLQSVIEEQIELTIALTPESDVLRADPTQIEQVLMNLCLNARDAMPDGGVLSIETQSVMVSEEFSQAHSDAVPGLYVVLSVSDTGMGMDAATLDQIFEPFFTTKETGKGTGLGLASVYGIVKQHGGFVTVDSKLGAGTVFHVYLPAGSGTPEARTAAVSDKVTRGTETILVAEDYAGLREVVEATLASQGYRIILASDGPEAVRLFQEKAKEIQLAVLDVVMPGLSGPEAYLQMRAIKPDLPVIFTTGHSAELVSLNSTIDDGAVFLQKPYTPGALSQTVRSTLNDKDKKSDP